MSSIYRLLETYAPLIYIGLGLWGMFVIRSMFNGRDEWRNSVYALEREFALRRLIRHTLFGLLVLILFFTEFVIVTFVVPSLPAENFLLTPTLDLLAPAPNSTVSADAVALGTLPANAISAPSGMSGCVPGKAMLTSPEPGGVVTGTVEIIGSAQTENFGFYKFEFSSIGSSDWSTLSAGDQAQNNEKLGEWDTTTLINGDYFLRLVVVDNAGQSLEPCVIAVRVENQ